MSVQTAVVKPLESGYMQVDSTYKNGYKRHFKVPQANAKKFAIEYKELYKKQRLYDNVTFITAMLTAFLGSIYFTKNIQNKWKQFAIQTCSTIGASMLASLGYAKYAQDEQREFLKDYKAKEIYYKRI